MSSPPTKPTPDEISVELSGQRTELSFQRTRLTADRTLMSVIRTSLSLISFGFTIHQVFGKLAASHALGSSSAARNFGMALVSLGILMLVLGIIYHLQFMRGLRHERAALNSAHLIHAESRFPVSLTLLIALALLMIGIAAILSMIFSIGPFG